MTSQPIDYTQQFNRADQNHDGILDEREFRQFLGPVQDEKKIPRNISPQDAQKFSSSLAKQTLTYEIGLDVAVAGFVDNPIAYEVYTRGISSNKSHHYGLGPDVGIGAPDIAKKTNPYDPAGAMFNFADVNHDGKIDQQEFGSFMRSV